MATAALNGATAQSPNQTLYVSNLNDKLSKPDLRRALYMLFSTFGPVLDIVALKTPKMRGQAHVVFRDVGTCHVAMREMQDAEFFGKPMKLSYGKGKSRIISRLDGSAALGHEMARKEKDAQQQQQKSIFSAPPPSGAAPTAPGVSQQAAKAGGELRPLPTPAAANAPSPRKRPREEEEEEDEEGGEAMDESDGDAMDESD